MPTSPDDGRRPGAEITITYTGGMTSTAPLKVTDRARTARFGEKTAIIADGRRVSIRHIDLPVDPAREAAWFTSPAIRTIKVFALSTRAPAWNIA